MKSLAATVSAILMTATAGTAAAGPYDKDYGYYNHGYGYNQNDYSQNDGYGYEDRDGSSSYRYENGPYGRGYYDYARVVDINPIVQVVNRPVSRQQCYENGYDNGYANRGDGYDDRYGRDNRYDSNSGPNGGKLVGGLIGGALGNLVGKGDGRKAATIAGALIGYNVAGASQRNGYDNDYTNRGGYYDGDSSGNCRTVTEYRRTRQIVGYDVTYDYRGRVQHVRSAVDPGERIRVRVDVRPEV